MKLNLSWKAISLLLSLLVPLAMYGLMTHGFAGLSLVLLLVQTAIMGAVALKK